MLLQYLGRILLPWSWKRTGCEITGRKCSAHVPVGEESNCSMWKALQGIVNPVMGNVYSSKWKRDKEKVQTMDHLVACWVCFGPLQAALSKTLPGALYPKDSSHYGRGYIKPGPFCLQHCPTRLCIFLFSHMLLGIPQGMKLSPSGSCCKNTSQLGCNAVLTLFQITTSPAKWDNCVLEP